jgi:hypothetical protein
MAKPRPIESQDFYRTNCQNCFRCGWNPEGFMHCREGEWMTDQGGERFFKRTPGEWVTSPYLTSKARNCEEYNPER